MKGLRVLVTRPGAAAERTMAQLLAMGHDPVAAPLFTIEPTEAVQPKGNFVALVATSQNGAEGLNPSERGLPAGIPAFSVGDRTGDVLRANGFSEVKSADGDQEDLAGLVLSSLTPPGRILLATGDPHKPGLEEALRAAGFETQTWVRYRSVLAPELPLPARDALADAQPIMALHYSRRASEGFLALAAAAGLDERARDIHHLCLSEDVAEPLRLAGCTHVKAAVAPDEGSLMALLAEEAAPVTVPQAGPEPEPDPLAVAPASGHIDEGRMASPQVSSPPPPAQRAGAGKVAIALLAGAIFGGVAGAGVSAYLPAISGAVGLPAPATAERAAIAALQDRLAKLEAAPAPAAPVAPPPNAAVEAGLRAATTQIGELRQSMQSLERRVSDAASQPSAPVPPVTVPGLDDLKARLDRAEQGVAQAQAATSALAPRLADVEGVARSAAARPVAPVTNHAAILVLAERTQRLAQGGAGFAPELRALQALGVSAAPLQALAGIAEKGAPTIASLTAEFRRLRAAMVVETGAADPGWSERLLRMTDGLVRVRPVGEPQGSSPGAITARLEQALERGDAAAAAAAWAALPEPARRASESLNAALATRAGADQALKTILDDAIKALSAAR